MLGSGRPWLVAFLLGVLPCAAVSSFTAHDAVASTAIALSLDDLVEKSEVIVVATAASKTSRWEAGHIVTYTTITVEAPVAGGPKAGDALVVRTLGGTVGNIGQKTFGEAVLPVGAKLVLFLHALPPSVVATSVAGARSVTGMEQGVLPVVVAEDKQAHIGALPSSLDLVPPKKATGVPARAATEGRLLQDVLADVKALWIAHGKK
jgi:hypothetical protein